ncbi:MAG: ceramidase domain-containing protein [Anaerolineae bacterium]|nr:ceramidase domain-containing protein [Anaerolineae bacterium]
MPSWLKTTFGLLLVAGALLALEASPYVWDGWLPATCWPDCSCETLRHAGVRTPLNTYTNLAYVAAAVWMWNALPAEEPRRYGVIFVAATLALGLGSFFFHASLTFAGQWFDAMGMYLLIGFILLYALARWPLLNGKAFAIAYVLLNASLGVLLIVAPALRRQVFMAELVVAALLEVAYLIRRRPPIRWGYLAAGLTTFFISDRFRAWDLAPWACRPESWLQFHPLYHCISALALCFIFVYYRSERE